MATTLQTQLSSVQENLAHCDTEASNVKFLVDNVVKQASTLVDLEDIFHSLPNNPSLSPIVPVLCRLLSAIPALTDSINELHAKVDSNTIQIKKNSEKIQILAEHVDQNQKDVEEVTAQVKKDMQYSRLPSLIIHGLRKVPFRKKGTAFSIWAAEQINRLLPKLPERIGYWDIHASHPLGKAVIVRFQRRDLRNEIYRRRFHLSDNRVSISEHLTDDNLDLYHDTVAATSRKNVWTDQCKIFASGNGKRRVLIKQHDDINKIAASSKNHTRNTNASNPVSTPTTSNVRVPSASAITNTGVKSSDPTPPIKRNTITMNSVTTTQKKVFPEKLKSQNCVRKLPVSRDSSQNPAHINFRQDSIVSSAPVSNNPYQSSCWSARPSSFGPSVPTHLPSTSSSYTHPDLRCLTEMFPNAHHSFL